MDTYVEPVIYCALEWLYGHGKVDLSMSMRAQLLNAICYIMPLGCNILPASELFASHALLDILYHVPWLDSNKNILHMIHNYHAIQCSQLQLFIFVWILSNIKKTTLQIILVMKKK